MTKKATSIRNASKQQEIANKQIPSDINTKLSSDETGYGKFHAIAIVLIVLIFLLKISSSSAPMKPNHEGLSTQTNQTTTTANIIIASQ